MNPRRPDKKQEHRPYSIHGVANSQNSINSGFSAYGSSNFMITRKESVIESAKKVSPWFKQKYRKLFRKKTITKRLPILQWLPKYNADDFIGDLIAGVTVGLTVIPQALAYAGIAGLPPQSGLYGSFVGCLLYIFIGSCRCVNIGPSSTSSFLTGQVAGGNWPRAIVCGVIAGFIELGMGLFGLGFVIDFVSGPVLSGFSSAVAIMIFTGQIKSFLGIHAKGFTFIQVWKSILKDIHNTRIGDTIMGLCCIVTLLLMRQLPRLKFGPEDDNQKSTWQKVINKIIWIIGTARNFLVVVTATTISYCLIQNGQGHWLLTIGEVPQGLPEFKIPSFSSPDVVNATGHVIEKGETFWEMISFMNIGLLAVPLIALIETMSINKSAAEGKSVDATQELIAIGAGKLVNSLVGAYPGNGSFSRGAINKASGARTPLGSLYSGILVIIALLYLTPYFQYIPDAALAAVIMAAVIFMVEYAVVKPLWRSKRSDLIPGLATFLCCLLFGIPAGTFIGVAVNILFVLFHAARPKIQVDKCVVS
uniref:CSON007755 protein n=1 Tax=Culicoides sonorensis TaxID=179676 RepID=A0A336MXD7_CULSO